MASARDCDPGQGPAPRIRFLDGLRGLAALYVVLHHAALMVPPEGLVGAELGARFLLRHGRYAVAVFIVLSGYCLMLPVARDGAGRLAGGTVAFLRRRIRRIVPAYYAAMAFCWLLAALVPAMAQSTGARWDRALPAWGQGVVASHLVLVHNLSDRWLFKIDPPMWSVATEWQIYVCFPLLLWIRRRAGLAVTVMFGFTCGLGVTALSFALQNPALRELCPWYLGLFALGMSAAVISSGPNSVGQVLTCRLRRFPEAGRLKPALQGRSLLFPVMVCLCVAAAIRATPSVRYLVVADALIGAFTAGLLVRWSRGRRTPLVRLLECRRAVVLGAFSYSLYLIHYPLLALADAALRGAGAAQGPRFWALTLAASPFCIVAAYVFHRAFERPFLGVKPAASAGASPRPRLLGDAHFQHAYRNLRSES